ncbi:MAG: DUF4097 family beta strand repeat-containing protein, partial [Bryobacteraceae bacterium]
QVGAAAGGPVRIAGAYSGVVQFHNLSKPLRFSNPFTQFYVEKIPGQARISLGDFSASNLVGPVHFASHSGDVRISKVSGSLEVAADRGDIRLQPGALPLARINAQTRSGDIELSIPPGANFNLTATAEHGEVVNDFGAPLNSAGEGGFGGTLRGSVGSGPDVKLHTDRGTITVRKASPGEKTIKRTTALPVQPLKTVEQ